MGGNAGEEIGYHTLFMYSLARAGKGDGSLRNAERDRSCTDAIKSAASSGISPMNKHVPALGVLGYLDTAADKITKAVLKDSSIAERCKGVGCLSKEGPSV